jgi:hypothetical protein
MALLLRVMAALEFFTRCDQTAVQMRLGARVASAKLTLLSRRGPTGRTSDSEHLFGSSFGFHGEEIMPHNPRTTMFNLEQF